MNLNDLELWLSWKKHSGSLVILLPFWFHISPAITACHFCPNWSWLTVWNPKETNTRWSPYTLLRRNDNLPRRTGILNLSTNLSSLESVLKVKCFMFRNFWAACCCSSSHLIFCSDFSSSLQADETTSVNLQNKTTQVVCFLVHLRPRLNYAKGIWKRRFHSETALNVFRPHNAGGI